LFTLAAKTAGLLLSLNWNVAVSTREGWSRQAFNNKPWEQQGSQAFSEVKNAAARADFGVPEA